jgi:hypothetical protein
VALSKLFPQSTRTQVITTSLTYIRQSKTLAGVKTWFLFQGDPKLDARDPGQSDLPALRIKVGSGPAQRIDEARHSTSLIFTHELWIAGCRQTDLMDFWTAVEQAWFDGTNNLLNDLQPFINWNITITGPIPEVRQMDGALAMYGVGKIVTDMDINT